jgi:hypothetical protein
MNKSFIFIAIFLVLAINAASAVVINSVQADTFAPSQEGQVTLEVENILNDVAEDVSITLSFQNTPFIPIGTSEQSVDEIDEDDDETFTFRIKAAPDVKPGDYEIPYTLTYTFDGSTKTKTGTVGIKVRANPVLTYTAESTNPIIGQKGKVTLKIVNQGFYSARFVSVKLLPKGFTSLSDDEAYIGEIASDDFQTTSFDVVFNSINADLVAAVEYTDFDNEKVTENVNLPIIVYTPQKATALGILPKSNLTFYISLIVIIIILIIVWRIIKKRRRLKRSMENKR